MTEMMGLVTSSGTARRLFDRFPQTVAGKTGTAQTASGNKEPHSWFTGFVPSKSAKIAFACVIEHGGYGKQAAASAMRDMLAAWMRF